MELLLGIFSSVCSGIIMLTLPKMFKSIKEANAKIEANNSATLSYLRSRILQSCALWQDKGYIPDHDAFAIQDMYDNYVALGGNGYVHKQVEKTLELPMTGGEN